MGRNAGNPDKHHGNLLFAQMIALYNKAKIK